MQHLSLLVEVAGLEEKWVEVKRHTGEVFQSSRTSLNEALSSKESQGLHVFSFFCVCWYVFDLASCLFCSCCSVGIFCCCLSGCFALVRQERGTEGK